MRLSPEQVVFCDNHLLALDKPCGLLCQPSGTAEDSLEAQGRLWLKEEFHKPGNVFLEAAHRIDRAVSGLVLFARTSKALSRLNAAQRTGDWRKTYHAIVAGQPSADTGRLVNWLRHDEHRATVVAPGTPEAREAVLTYRVLRRLPGSALLEIQLETGRYHQIRAQLADAGLPILGDRKYGSRTPWPSSPPGTEAIALRHVRLELHHPVGGAALCLETRLTGL